MFNKNFYPTPRNIIQKMLEPYSSDDLRQKYILEPSAGKGDIIDYIESKTDARWYVKTGKVYCIEQSPDLQAILHSKKYNVLGNDFLSFNSSYNFDLIVMNPPFDDGDKHLLKAWELLKHGDIVCLLNKETINNPYSKSRQLLANIIKENGTIEDLGSCFVDAERKTNVETVLIRLYKKDNQDSFEFKPTNSHEKHYNFEDTQNNQVAVNDFIENNVVRYENVKEQFVNLVKALNGIKYYANGLVSERDFGNLKETALNSINNDNKGSYNKFTSMFKEQCWANLLEQTKFTKLMSERVKKDFADFQKQQGGYDFTKENINILLDTLFNSRHEILERSIEDVFETLTSFDAKNKVHIEGWKTNDAWKVNKKFIIPYCVELAWDKNFIQKRYQKGQFLHDLDKVMCFLDGKKIEEVKTINGLFEEHRRLDPNMEYETEFFKMRFYKKGTSHFTFKDEKLWNRFNIRACKMRNWLPNDYDKSEI